MIVVERPTVPHQYYEYYAFEYGSCGFDSLTMTEGDGRPLLAKTCGSDLPPDLTSTTGTVRVTFHTDGGTNESGWRLAWTAVPPGT